ncbi:helix-turn-helix transcriptional regulator [Brenneria izadpanahii]|uniref:Helix-turn-helix transcriptional regulator n=1 Tax=Brenneria izadpanahii TaxID=2722756 RepID=A0ABX7UPN4_9GAMM|nr:helix-turn-helix transcriptional regulator [Brenneria izadpanahii]QTF07643.1 helix-turn-helix transcriptional regulator [Brenneria izadpanahii]
MKNTAIDYLAIGQRLRAYRIAASLNAEQIASALGISRAAVYRLEKGDIKKIETLERLAECLHTTFETLLGVGMEYYSHASGFFERMRQLEENSTRIYSHFDPFSYLLTSEHYDDYLKQMLLEADNNRAHSDDLDEKSLQTLDILFERKSHLNKHLPKIHNLIGIQHIEKFIHLGLIGTLNISPSARMERVLLARQEVQHLLQVLEEKKHIVQVAITTETIPSSTFQIFYKDSEPLSVASSPFRLGELPNIHSGVAWVSSSKEAILHHQSLFDGLWNNAAKGEEACRLLQETLDRF